MYETITTLQLFHSIVRWLVLLSVAGAGIVALKGYMLRGPILVWERMLAILAMVTCHIQLVMGLSLYAMRFKHYDAPTARGMGETVQRFWKYEHIAMMILAVALVTMGRMLSKRAETERGKQLRVAIFYLLALIIMLMMIPWPFTAIGMAQGTGWL